jgi:hypothetical protein
LDALFFVVVDHLQACAKLVAHQAYCGAKCGVWFFAHPALLAQKEKNKIRYWLYNLLQATVFELFFEMTVVQQWPDVGCRVFKIVVL